MDNPKTAQAEPITPTEYEVALAERLRSLFPPPAYEVVHNVRHPGRSSQSTRQLDVVVYAQPGRQLVLAAEAKFHRRPVTLPVAGSWIALLQDTEISRGILASTTGFSRGAVNHLSAEGIDHMILTVEEAEGLRWLPAIKRSFGILGFEFREVSGELMEALRTGQTRRFLSPHIPYEELVSVCNLGLRTFHAAARDTILRIASDHPDDGYRFNAVQILGDNGCLTRVELLRLLDSEPDGDTVELLERLLAEI